LNIFLIGYRGTGKTTIGNVLARRLGKRFIDADVYLEQKEGRTIREIFEEDGEEGFRDIESRIVEELCLQDDSVIATGGGAILRDDNAKKIKASGITVFLEADVDAISKRINKDNQTYQKRPNLTKRGGYQEIEYLLEKRRPHYDKAADFVINTSKMSINEAVEKIASFIRSYVTDLRSK